MKFRFCGGGDCPDWLLMQINTLSALSIEHFQELSEAVAQSLLGTEIDYSRMRDIAKEAGLDMSEIKACLSGLNFTLKSGTRHGVAADELGAELEQLGLKSRHAARLTAIYSERREALTTAAAAGLLRIAVPQKINATPTGQGVLLDLQARDYGGRLRQVEFTMTREQALLMLTELKTVQKKMEKLVPE
uniref:Putative comm domain-containing protein 4 n=1 Tax=Panstrongylus lignarius TaxID=156445 RepID=A0A224XQB5_9HEMI